MALNEKTQRDNETNYFKIGLNLGHNASIVLTSPSGKQIRLEEEKVAQIKGFYGFPIKSSKIIKQQIDTSFPLKIFVGGTEIYEIFASHRLLIKYFNQRKLSDILWISLDIFKMFFPKTKVLHKTIKQHLIMKLKWEFKSVCEIQFVDHHKAHALSAVIDSGFKEALVFTQDGKGDFYSGKVYSWREAKLQEIHSQAAEDSLGLIYGAVTKAIGFKQLRHEGKITGLAALGKSNETVLERIRQHRIKLKTKGRENQHVSKMVLTKKLRQVLSQRMIDTELLFYGLMFESWVSFFKEQLSNNSREDIAATVQSFVEHEVLTMITETHRTNREYENVALAGGLFANVKLNQRIWDSEMFTSMFVAPAMDDAGIALGAVGVDDAEIPRRKPTLENCIYLGSSSFCEIKDPMIEEKQLGSEESFARSIADAILGEKIVGTYFGQLEWGPRSLGNRSILANAFNIKTPSVLNLRLNRNDFMPFAPMVLEEDAFKIFRNYSSDLIAARFMTITLDVNKEYIGKIPSVVHKDGTARPQIIDKNGPRILRLVLEQIKTQTGMGICVNTSFNMHESPILFSLQTAIDNLKKGAVDLVVTCDLKIYSLALPKLEKNPQYEVNFLREQ